MTETEAPPLSVLRARFDTAFGLLSMLVLGGLGEGETRAARTRTFCPLGRGLAWRLWWASDLLFPSLEGRGKGRVNPAVTPTSSPPPSRGRMFLGL